MWRLLLPEPVLLQVLVLLPGLVLLGPELPVSVPVPCLPVLVP